MNDRSDTEVDMPDEPSQQPDATAPDAATDTAAPAFTAAVERAVGQRLAEAERRWQSKKDREIHRERLRLRQESSSEDDLGPEVLDWLATADANEIGAWLKREMTGVAHPAGSEPDAAGDASDEFVAADAHTSGPAGPSTPEIQAAARERLALARAEEPSPDLSPSLSGPADAFHEIEARFARGEIGLADYESARRRRGLD
jgi:hypothetical protein